MILKKWNTVFFIAIIISLISFVSSTAVFAFNENVTEEIEETTVFQHTEVQLGKFSEFVTEIEGVKDEENLIAPLTVDTTKNLSLGIGKSWSTSFNMNNWFGDDHNTFNVKVSDVTSGKYKVLITATNGFNYEGQEYTGGSTITISNAQSNVNYTVTIVNTSTSNLVAKVNITSYIR